MMSFLIFNFCVTMVLMANPGSTHMDLDPVRDVNERQGYMYSRFEYEYEVLQKLVDLENENKEQNKINEELMKKNTELKTEIDGIKNVSSEYKEAYTELRDALKVERHSLQFLTSRFEKLSSSSKGGDQRSFYGFSAYESSSKTVSVGNTIVLSRVRLNEGDAYDTRTGQFTAPVDGIYIFHATLCIYCCSKYIYVAFMAGEEVLGRFASNDKDYQSCHSGSALARLQKGSHVFLRVTDASSGSVLYDDIIRMNSFSGFLVGV